jgi:hypothetical protein
MASRSSASDILSAKCSLHIRTHKLLDSTRSLSTLAVYLPPEL